LSPSVEANRNSRPHAGASQAYNAEVDNVSQNKSGDRLGMVEGLRQVKGAKPRWQTVKSGIG